MSIPGFAMAKHRLTDPTAVLNGDLVSYGRRGVALVEKEGLHRAVLLYWCSLYKSWPSIDFTSTKVLTRDPLRLRIVYHFVLQAYLGAIKSLQQNIGFRGVVDQQVLRSKRTFCDKATHMLLK